MKKINLMIMAISLLFIISCGSESSKTENKTEEVKKEVEKKVEEVKKEETKTEEASSAAIGVGPITKVELKEIDDALAETGKSLFKSKGCIACHKMNKRKVGPALTGVTTRRAPEWIMNMIMNPTEMVEKDATAKALLAEYSAPMSDQHLTEEETKAVLEFFRQNDNKK